MDRSAYLKIMVTLMAAAVVLFGILIVNALDRVCASNVMLADKLAALPAQLAQVAPVQAVAPAGVPSDGGAAAPVANREFFDQAATPGGRLIQATMADTQNMNYLINNDATVSEFYGYCGSSLATRNYAKPEEFQPLMAESWEISPDHKEYRIKLRKGILWHDFTDPVSGKEWKSVEVTAADFKFFLDVVRNPDVNCAPLRVYYQDLESIEITNDYEFVIRWKKEYYGSLTATLGLSPLPRHLYHAYPGPFDGRKFNDDHERNRILVGCGPYKLLRWEKDVRVIFDRFNNYFGNRYGIRPPLDTIAFELIKHPNTRFQALQAGQLDKLGLTPEQWIKRTDIPQFTDGTLKKYHYLAQAYTYIGYNLRNPLFADRRVRQALTMLTDREKILKEVLFGLGVIINGPFFPESAYYNKGIAPYPYDPARAKKLLAEAGWRDSDGDGILDKDGRKFSFTIMQVGGHPTQSKMLPMLKESFALAGIELKIQPLEWSVCLQRIDQRNFESCAMAWTMPLDPDPYQVWHSTQAELPQSSNFIGYRNPELDRLIEELRVTFDRDRRVELCHRMAEILHEDQPYTFLYTPYSLQALSGRYRNVRVFPVGIPDDIIWTPRALQRAVPGL